MPTKIKRENKNGSSLSAEELIAQAEQETTQHDEETFEDDELTLIGGMFGNLIQRDLLTEKDLRDITDPIVATLIDTNKT